VLFEGEDLLARPNRKMREIRGSRIAMIFQNPYAALNPLISIGDQLVETQQLHERMSRADASKSLVALLERLGIADARRVMRSRPYQVSGGTNQRIMLALALIGGPQLLIADEPTTMLDAITQIDIFKLMLKLRGETGMAIWLITHDFGAVALMADSVVVMYAGRPVEWASAATILREPKHPYTSGLIASVPSMRDRKSRLTQIPGEPPDLRRAQAGCAFADRCGRAMPVCRELEPPVVPLPDGARVRCWLYADIGAAA
jgi:oligopeptide/dipeptide ABC transporter ATP-binding protein